MLAAGTAEGEAPEVMEEDAAPSGSDQPPHHHGNVYIDAGICV